MAKYTIELDWLLRNNFDLGLTPSDYPIFDENYRLKLNNKLLEHYRYNEIGSETANKFKYYLNRSMNEIMPYYNQLYESALLSIEPLLDYKKSMTGNKSVDTTVDQNIDSGTSVNSTSQQTSELTADQEGLTTNETNNKTLAINSKTPQSEILVGDIENNLYADEATVDTGNVNIVDRSEQTKTDTGTVDTTGSNIGTSFSDNVTITDVLETWSENEEGFNTSQSELLLRFRETILNIDMMVINDPSIRDCFMLLY